MYGSPSYNIDGTPNILLRVLGCQHFSEKKVIKISFYLPVSDIKIGVLDSKSCPCGRCCITLPNITINDFNNQGGEKITYGFYK